MGYLDLKKDMINLEARIRDESVEFEARYMAASELRRLIKAYSWLPSEHTLEALYQLISDPGPRAESRGYFLYREGALSLSLIASRRERLWDKALFLLKSSLKSARADQNRAISEAISSLPLDIKGPMPSGVQELAFIPLEKALSSLGIHNQTKFIRVGRSLFVPDGSPDRIFVIKTVREAEGLKKLVREVQWMLHLGRLEFQRRFDVPEPVSKDGIWIIELCEKEKVQGICFYTHPDYFTYPNESGSTLIDKEQLLEIMCRNAFLLGRLTSLGIVHTAPIPLFHNRVQRQRRDDQGLYQWWRAGRLDRWLDSCAYPNFGITGLRDLEHILSFQGTSIELFRHIGAHFLSLFLVAGSYFRCKDPKRRGLEANGRPADTRDLFDPALFKQLVSGIFTHYYQGFTGCDFSGSIPYDVDHLIHRMIEEMGVDRHMEEVLRVADQRRMSQQEFQDFLLERGYSMSQVNGIERGKEDLVILTGPHLGGFNQRISLPEMIEAIGSMAAHCIAGRWIVENSGRA